MASVETGETRSRVIRQALREWLDKKTLGGHGWPLLLNGIAFDEIHAPKSQFRDQAEQGT
jgi:Arc/MetJ-type ribon-helix-helix transcriptional regulator